MGGEVRARAGTALLDIARGALIGVAEAVPGVSGGTVALVVGVYDRLIASISAAAASVGELVRGRASAARTGLAAVDVRLLVALALGMAPALLGALWVLAPLIERHPVPTSAALFGLIAGSLTVPWRRIHARTPARLAMVVGSAVVAFVLAGLPARVVPDPALGLVFAAAAVAVCALILPGVSGAYFLAAFGVYVPVADAVRSLDLALIGVFVAGAVTGLALFSRPLDYLLARRPDATMAVLLGLMAGGLRALWPWQADDRSLAAPPLEPGALVAAGLALGGFVAVRLLVAASERVRARAARSGTGW